jgi:23S rRNA pseudouridine2605 synthase
MRLNKFISERTLLSRRKADAAIEAGRVRVNGETPVVGQQTTQSDNVTLDGRSVGKSDESASTKYITILLNKPVGYVCSKNGQGSRTIYSLLPKEYLNLNIAGRLDKDSSGLVVLTNDGELLNELTHPSKNKDKVYEVELDGELKDSDIRALLDGINIGEKTISRFIAIKPLDKNKYEVVLHEGRNRQIRKMVNKLHYSVVSLLRTSLGDYNLNDIPEGKFKVAHVKQ